MPYKNKEKEREYQKQYHLRTWKKRRLKHLELKRKRRFTLAAWLKTYKLPLKCTSCGEDNSVCLDFHHKNSKEKESSVADMVSEGYSIASITEEINKCIVLCRNCHAKIHSKDLIL
jgi:hypothetical protein